ncbi:MAG: hypothetical protein FJ271_14065 [Planctomycetes bacterium]|nr:hypothetical protein [Planctomycetota bacterium]
MMERDIRSFFSLLHAHADCSFGLRKLRGSRIGNRVAYPCPGVSPSGGGDGGAPVFSGGLRSVGDSTMVTAAVDLAGSEGDGGGGSGANGSSSSSSRCTSSSSVSSTLRRSSK